jgi:hypothetical protein
MSHLLIIQLLVEREQLLPPEMLQPKSIHRTRQVLLFKKRPQPSFPTSLKQDAIAAATSYEMKYRPEDHDLISWRILGEQEQLEWGNIISLPEVEAQDNIPPLEEDSYLNKVFFQRFFPSLWLCSKSRPNCSLYQRPKQE